MVPEAAWQVGNPAHRVEYSCAGQPAVVEYDWGKGHVVWWAGSTPLENGSPGPRPQPRPAAQLAGAARRAPLLLGRVAAWGDSLDVELCGRAGADDAVVWPAGAGVLVVFSFSRRSGPVRDLPVPARATPIEFLEALGSLYRNAGAASTAVAIAWERFRRQTLRLCGQRGSQMGAAELAAVIRRRFPRPTRSLEADLAACEEAAWGETIEPREALKLVQSSRAHAKTQRRGQSRRPRH